jgi:prephenate dehydrogenase
VKVALLGFGLIGGSVARALRRAGATAGLDGDGPPRISAWSPSGDGPTAALHEGVIDEAATDPRAAVDGAGLIVLAGPVPACLTLLDDLAGELRPALDHDAVITDVASTKVALALRATVLGLRYVGGHPMAGRETTGVESATADLFVDRPWVVTPAATDDAAAGIAVVEGLATAVGARPIRMTAAEHDAAVAAISHLPLVAAAALVESVASDPAGWASAGLLAASGWRDMTRLARGDTTMGGGIMATNATAVAARTRDLIAVLGAWADELEREGGPDPDAIRRRLDGARDVLESAS